MKTKTTFLFNSLWSAAAARSFPSRIGMSLVTLGLVLTGFGPALKRPEVTQQKLLKQRSTSDQQAAAEGRKVISRFLEHTKTEYDRSPAGERKGPAAIHILLCPGGGELGAF